MLEIIAETVSDAVAAEAGGATQLDLKCAFEIDGLTPSLGMIEQICARVNIDVVVMVRAHRKSFVLVEEDIIAMCRDIRLASGYNVAGFLLGALTPEREIDAEAIKRFQEAANDLPLNFHLAWEQTNDPRRSLERLVELGIKSVRTTGGHGLGAKAINATKDIKLLHEQVGDEIYLFLAGGVSPENIGKLVKETGVRNAHAGGSVRVPADPSGDVVESRVRLLRKNLDQAVNLL